jgi:hypothetical protein
VSRWSSTPRDAELERLLRGADSREPVTDETLARLGTRIIAAAAPLLDERAAAYRTVWDYAERWAVTLLPVGAVAAVAAGLCLFALTSHQPRPQRAPGVRVALLGAATNRMSSQSLVDFLVSGDAAAPAPARAGR